MYQKHLNLPNLLKKKSFFLFGARSTGKTTLFREQPRKAKVYDLLDAEVYKDLLKRPKLIEEQSGPKDKLVVIDEVQKLPQILDEVQRLIGILSSRWTRPKEKPKIKLKFGRGRHF